MSCGKLFTLMSCLQKYTLLRKMVLNSTRKGFSFGNSSCVGGCFGNAPVFPRSDMHVQSVLTSPAEMALRPGSIKAPAVKRTAALLFNKRSVCYVFFTVVCPIIVSLWQLASMSLTSSVLGCVFLPALASLGVGIHSALLF